MDKFLEVQVVWYFSWLAAKIGPNYAWNVITRWQQTSLAKKNLALFWIGGELVKPHCEKFMLYDVSVGNEPLKKVWISLSFSLFLSPSLSLFPFSLSHNNQKWAPDRNCSWNRLFSFFANIFKGGVLYVFLTYLNDFYLLNTNLRVTLLETFICQ